MKITDLLKIIKKISEVNNLSEPFICGGTPRDKVLGKIKENLNDIDLTTGNEDISRWIFSKQNNPQCCIIYSDYFLF